MEQTRSLATVSLDTVANAFVEAFSDYERTRSAEEYKRMLKRRGYVPELSFGAFNHDQLVSFTLNGIGMYSGLPTAYDTGTGTIKEYRGRKLAGKIFEASIPHLQQAGVRQYLLEVLQHNKAAISVYNSLGFEVSRELNYYFQERIGLMQQQEPINRNIELQTTTLQPELMQQMWDCTPSWQNSFDSIMRIPAGMKVIGAFEDELLVGYGVVEPQGGDIVQIAVAREYRRKGIGKALMSRMVPESNVERILVINVESTCISLTSFLERLGFPLAGRQFEMIKHL